MDLAITGKFIQERRKAKNLTQAELAERLNVSEKTISKWECGKGFPDTSLMLPLCKALDISANELLCGKLLADGEEYKKQADDNLLALKKKQERTTKWLLVSEWFILGFAIAFYLACVSVAAYVDMATGWRIALIAGSFLAILPALVFCIFIETRAGYYQCAHCGHKYVPSFKQTFGAMHMGRTRYMKCPCCQKKSWQKKTATND